MSPAGGPELEPEARAPKPGKPRRRGDSIGGLLAALTAALYFVALGGTLTFFLGITGPFDRSLYGGQAPFALVGLWAAAAILTLITVAYLKAGQDGA